MIHSPEQSGEFAQVVIEMGAGETGGGAEVAGHIETSKGRRAAH